MNCLASACVPRWALVGVVLAGVGCSGGDGGPGAPCGGSADCAADLQCFTDTCAPRCAHAPECGDGHACTADGVCVPGAGQPGDDCGSEVECAAGLACLLDTEDLDDDGVLAATCAPDQDGGPVGASCEGDDDCRSSTCALGRCVDLCAIDRDCAQGFACTAIPRVEVANAPSFDGCLPTEGTLAWTIPLAGPSDQILLPVPDLARSALLVMAVDAPGQAAGATRVETPDGVVVYRTPLTEAEIFANLVRHVPAQPASVLALPGTPELALVPGAYRIGISSFRLVGQPGTATPRVEAMIKVDDGIALDLHFHFLDLGEHACREAFGGDVLDVERAAAAPFQAYVQELRTLFGLAGVALRTLTYTDLPGHPDLDALTAAELPALLALGEDRGGINVFVVRTMTPAGLQAMVGGTPGVPSGEVGPLGGVAVAVDALCTRSWEQLARSTAHVLARHLGLFRNREPRGQLDPIADSDSDEHNLMFFSELGGSTLSPGQRDVLRRSPVLR